MIKQVKNTLEEPNGQKIAERLYERELQRTNQKKKKKKKKKKEKKKKKKKKKKKNRIEKVIKRKGDKLYIKWKNYDNIVV